MNEIACAILDVAARRGARAARSSELGTTHPHYLRLRAAVADFLAHPERAPEALEIAMFLRGRDHFFVLRPTPLRAPDGDADGADPDAPGRHLPARPGGAPRAADGDALARAAHAAHLAAHGASTCSRARSRRSAPQARSLVDAAREDVLRLEDVAQRLLDALALARDDASRSSARASRCASWSSARRASSRLQARERGVALETRSRRRTSCAIAGDATKLGWALSNLIGNALRYTPRGGVDPRRGARRSPSVVRISVSDSGPGIPPEQRERIFERFAQGEEPGAAGLGLAIVRDVVQAHGGRIFLESELGHGSRFTLELPRDAAR